MFLSRVFLKSPRDEKSISRVGKGRGKYRWNDFVFGSGQGPGGTHGLWWERAASSDPLPSTPSLPVQGALWQSFLPSTRTPRILHGGWLCQIPKYVPQCTLEASLCDFFQSPGIPTVDRSRQGGTRFKMHRRDSVVEFSAFFVPIGVKRGRFRVRFEYELSLLRRLGCAGGLAHGP